MGQAPCREALGWNTIDHGAAPGSGTVGEKVRVLREVSLPMQLNELVPGYAKFEVARSAGQRC
jgi:hypothetical protein